MAASAHGRAGPKRLSVPYLHVMPRALHIRHNGCMSTPEVSVAATISVSDHSSPWRRKSGKACSSPDCPSFALLITRRVVRGAVDLVCNSAPVRPRTPTSAAKLLEPRPSITSFKSCAPHVTSSSRSCYCSYEFVILASLFARFPSFLYYFPFGLWMRSPR